MPAAPESYTAGQRARFVIWTVHFAVIGLVAGAFFILDDYIGFPEGRRFRQAISGCGTDHQRSGHCGCRKRWRPKRHAR